MSRQIPSTEDIARVAHAIWEAEGHPEGRDHEHWMRAKQLLEEGRAEAEVPAAFASAGNDAAARPVQPGFKDAPPGIVPEMKEDAGAELREGPGGRFAKQVAEAPESRGDDLDEAETPERRSAAPISPAKSEEAGSMTNADAPEGQRRP